MIIKDFAKSRFSSNEPPSMLARIEFEELCSVCERDIPNGVPILRHTKSKNIICIFCVLEITTLLTALGIKK